MGCNSTDYSESIYPFPSWLALTPVATHLSALSSVTGLQLLKVLQFYNLQHAVLLFGFTNIQLTRSK